MNYLKKNKEVFDNIIDSSKNLKSMKLDATYLAWVDFNDTGNTEGINFKKLVFEAKIISNPGSSFGLGGDNHFRFNLANSTELVEKAAYRIKSKFS